MSTILYDELGDEKESHWERNVRMLQSIRDLYDLLPLESVNYDDFLALYAAMKHYLDLIQGARDIPSNALSVPALLESIADHVIDGFHSLLAYSVQQQPDSQLAMILLDDLARSTQ